MLWVLLCRANPTTEKVQMVSPSKLPQRILVIGLPGSGASLFCYYLSQHSHVAAVIDLYDGKRPPNPEDLEDVPDDVTIVLKTGLHVHGDEESYEGTINTIINIYQPNATVSLHTSFFKK